MSKHIILIADSGATKTNWCLLENGNMLHRFNTKGISPVFQTREEISEEIKKYVYPQLQEKKPMLSSFMVLVAYPKRLRV